MMTLKQKLMIPLAAMLVAGAASAQVTSSFAWFNSPANSLTDSSGTGILANNATVLTFLTGDNTFNPVTAMNPDSHDTWADVASAFSFYRAMPNSLDTRFITVQMAEDIDDGTWQDVRGQYAWAVVLDMPYASWTGNFGDIGQTTSYGVTGVISPAIENLDTTPATPPQNFTGYTIQTSEVIPEPSVFALMGLGGLLVMIRRRFVVKS